MKILKKRHSTIESWKKMEHYSSNETIFKYSHTLLDNIEKIVTNSPQERIAVIKCFTKRGITKLPDGRKIEKIVK